MECFNHNGIQGIGICKSCGKSVCRECAKIFPKGLACSEECEHDAKELIEMNERGKKLYGIGKYKNNKLASGVWVWLLLTIVMWGSFGLSYFNQDDLNYYSLGMGIVFSIITLIIYRASKNTGIQC